MKNIFDLENEIAVVTGALGKLGAIWIGALLEAGASVFALDLPGTRVPDDFKKLQAEFEDPRLSLGRTDVRDRPSLEAICTECLQTLGTPSILVNNAGIDQPPADSSAGYRLE